MLLPGWLELFKNPRENNDCNADSDSNEPLDTEQFLFSVLMISRDGWMSPMPPRKLELQ